MQSTTLARAARQRAAMPSDERLSKPCLYCGMAVFCKPYQYRSKKYCSRRCFRAFMAERFDRWLANPESIALPQCYDEFLTQDVLPCLVEGCDWVGQHLGTHVNQAHGVTARNFKQLGGFNVGTGLVTPAISDALASRPHLVNSLLPPDWVGHPPAPAPYHSLESREHASKSRTLAIALHVPTQTITCRHCGAAVLQPYMGNQLYCSVACRTSWAQAHQRRLQAICVVCGALFLASYAQTRRHEQGLPVTCSHVCRGILNGSKPKRQHR